MRSELQKNLLYLINLIPNKMQLFWDVKNKDPVYLCDSKVKFRRPKNKNSIVKQSHTSFLNWDICNPVTVVSIIF